MSSRSYSISKSSFIKFEQCHKAFYFYRNHPYLRDKLSVDKQLTFKRGHDVGFFARQLFPGGRDVSAETKNSEEALTATAKLIAEGVNTIYEAAFVFNGVLIMVDILHRDGTRYFAYEVKSSMKVSETYLKDACLQYYVLKNTLPGFEDLFLVTINPDYVRENEIEPKKLFRRRSVKQRAEENLPYFQHQLQAAMEVLERAAIPNVAVGKHCFRPYQCDFFGTCWKEQLHERSIFNLPLVDKGRLFEWHSGGIKSIDEVGNDLLEKETLIRVKSAVTSGEPVINRERIAEIISRINEPIATMDMEVWNPAIPQLPGTRPFEQIPFLVSFFNGNHYSWFYSGNEPGVKKANSYRVFAEELLRLSANYQSIVVYDKTLEMGIINQFIAMFPDLKTVLEKLKSRLVDLFDVFLSLAYYHPEFKSNFSLKVVSSVLVKGIDYSGISSGLEAMSYYDQFRNSTDEAEKEQIKNSLITYCNTDCLATYRVFEYLRDLVKY